jgi:hypothetical protein
MSSEEAMRIATQLNKNTWLAFMPTFHIIIHDSIVAQVTETCPSPGGTYRDTSTAIRTWIGEGDIISGGAPGIEFLPDQRYNVSIPINTASMERKLEYRRSSTSGGNGRPVIKDADEHAFLSLAVPIPRTLPGNGGFDQSWFHASKWIARDLTVDKGWFYDSGEMPPDEDPLGDVIGSRKTSTVRIRFAVSKEPITDERWQKVISK